MDAPGQQITNICGNKQNIDKSEASSLKTEPHRENPVLGELHAKAKLLQIKESTDTVIQVEREPSHVNMEVAPLPLPEYNILLLGETGSGKSTTINAIANYLQFGSLEEANQHAFVELISSKFSLSHPKTGDEFPIISGKRDANEDDSEVTGGQSRTQAPMAYRFQYADRIIRIIDTPGMGDTRGLKVDKENFDAILAYLHGYSDLHGVVILLKANVNRELASFRYCLTELFTHLHKSATQNIIFCFTFARNTFYAPGDGFIILRRFLADEFPGITLHFGENSFFIDNEAYRYLVAKKVGYPFEGNQAEAFAESWSKSALQTSKMMRVILSLKPHNLEATFALNMAQNVINELAQPMVQLQKSVHSNLKTIQRQKAELERDAKNVERQLEATQKALKMVVEKVNIVRLKMPNTVCTAERCTSVIKIDSKARMHYKTVCCQRCPLKNIKQFEIGHTLLKYCEAFSHGNSRNCRFCGCSWQWHMHLQSEFKFTQQMLIDEKIKRQFEQQLRANEGNEFVSQKIIQTLEASLREYEHEIEEIQKVAAYFGYLLDVHSNSSFNSFIVPYLDLLIAEEEVKRNRISGYQNDTLKLLVELKSAQKKNVELVAEKIKSGQMQLNFNCMMEIIGKLTKLKHNGHQFHRIVDEFRQNGSTKVKNEERLGGHFAVPQVGSSPVAVAPQSVPAAVAPDNPSYLRKLVNLQFDNFYKDFQRFPEARIAKLQTLLALSEYMIYGGHEQANCDKLVKWMDKIFGQDASSLCQSLEGQITNQLQAKFQSEDVQVILQKKGDFTQWKEKIHKAAVLPADDLLVKELENAEKATMLENARKVASILEGEREGDATFLYLTSVLPLFLLHLPKGLFSEFPTGKSTDNSKADSLGEIGKGEGKVKESLPALVAKHPKDSLGDIPKKSSKDNSKYNLADIGKGKVKVKGGGGVSAWVKEHPKYSAGSLVAGGLALGGMLSLFQPWEEKGDTRHTWKVTETKTKETFLPVTVQEEATIDVALLLLAVACCLAAIGALAFAYYAYYARARPNGQQADGTESTKGKTAKQGEKKAKKVPIEAAKTGASSKSVSASSPATGQTST